MTRELCFCEACVADRQSMSKHLENGMVCVTCGMESILDIDQDENSQCWDCRHPQEEGS